MAGWGIEMGRWLALTFLAAVCAGCASQQHLAYVGPSGQHGSGQIAMNGVMGNGRFSITDKGVTCTGSFASWSALTINFPVTCSDGLAGTVLITRTMEGRLSAHGTMSLSNGETRQLVYGDATGRWKAL